ncbi:hypothetical protein B296_00006797 [Ensete ventricosum]|uniref:Uncharacterized protein n=1 Tax=Ensete ventricosum TaxID=4639 RepID=A0A427AJU3_ENSVE|nr:hypothetical protein B296_00006797 [Ensete ventricosum]
MRSQQKLFPRSETETAARIAYGKTKHRNLIDHRHVCVDGTWRKSDRCGLVARSETEGHLNSTREEAIATRGGLSSQVDVGPNRGRRYCPRESPRERGSWNVSCTRVFWEGVKGVRGEGPLEESEEEESAREGRRGWGRHPRVEVRERNNTSAVNITTPVWPTEGKAEEHNRSIQRQLKPAF